MNKVVREIMRVLLVFFTFTTVAIAADLDSMYGVWGTEAQCARTLITPKGTKHAAPFTIQSDWLGHGEVWCRLHWLTRRSNADGGFALVRAICGEDEARNYDIRFDLVGDELTLVWDLWLVNGPLMRCKR